MALKSAGPEMRSNPLTTSAVPLLWVERPADNISLGKLSPPLLTAVTLNLHIWSEGIAHVKDVPFLTNVPLSKSLLPTFLYTI